MFGYETITNNQKCLIERSCAHLAYEVGAGGPALNQTYLIMFIFETGSTCFENRKYRTHVLDNAQEFGNRQACLSLFTFSTSICVD